MMDRLFRFVTLGETPIVVTNETFESRILKRNIQAGRFGQPIFFL
jgi:hypothetical protein